MNRSQTKIRRIQEANRAVEDRFLSSKKENSILLEDMSGPTNTQNNQGTDFSKNVVFLFPDKTSVTIKPTKQDISKSIIDSLDTEGLVVKNTVDLSKQGASQMTCGLTPANQKVFIFTKPNQITSKWCKVENPNPEYMKNNGIFEIPNKYEFVSVGKSISEAHSESKKIQNLKKITEDINNQGTDFNKNVVFLFPDKSAVTIKPTKQDISKAIIDSLGTEGLVTKNTVDLSRQGAILKKCGLNPTNQKMFIFTKPNKASDEWCKIENPNPEYMKNNGIFEIPNKYEFISIGKPVSEAKSRLKTITEDVIGTDYTKNITFLFPDKTSVTIKPTKQDISKAIIDSLGTEGLVTKNTVDLSRQGASQMTCGLTPANQKVFIFTKPNQITSKWCKVENPNPEYMKNNGIFEIPNKYEFVSVGKSISGN